MITVNHQTFAKALRFVSTFASTDPYRPALSNVGFTIHPTGLWLYATDSYRLAWIGVPIEHTSGYFPPIVDRVLPALSAQCFDPKPLRALTSTSKAASKETISFDHGAELSFRLPSARIDILTRDDWPAQGVQRIISDSTSPAASADPFGFSPALTASTMAAFKQILPTAQVVVIKHYGPNKPVVIVPADYDVPCGVIQMPVRLTDPTIATWKVTS